MPLRPENTRITFRKLSRQLSKLAGKLSPENVHKFRTSSRRVEVLVSDLSEQRSGNDKKLLKLLARLRKKAGRVRDLDVQSVIDAVTDILREFRTKSSYALAGR